jgi:hypothetical protein
MAVGAGSDDDGMFLLGHCCLRRGPLFPSANSYSLFYELLFCSITDLTTLWEQPEKDADHHPPPSSRMSAPALDAGSVRIQDTRCFILGASEMAAGKKVDR